MRSYIVLILLRWLPIGMGFDPDHHPVHQSSPWVQGQSHSPITTEWQGQIHKDSLWGISAAGGGRKSDASGSAPILDHPYDVHWNSPHDTLSVKATAKDVVGGENYTPFPVPAGTPVININPAFYFSSHRGDLVHAGKTSSQQMGIHPSTPRHWGLESLPPLPSLPPSFHSPLAPTQNYLRLSDQAIAALQGRKKGKEAIRSDLQQVDKASDQTKEESERSRDEIEEQCEDGEGRQTDGDDGDGENEIENDIEQSNPLRNRSGPFAPTKGKPFRRQILKTRHNHVRKHFRTLWRQKGMYVGMDPRMLAVKVTEMKLQIGFASQVGHMAGNVARAQAVDFHDDGKYLAAYHVWISRFNKKVCALRKEYREDPTFLDDDESRERMVYEKFRDAQAREDMYGDGTHDALQNNNERGKDHDVEADRDKNKKEREKEGLPSSNNEDMEIRQDKHAIVVWSDFVRLRIRPTLGTIHMETLTILWIEALAHGWTAEGYTAEQTTEYLKRYVRRFLHRSQDEIDLFDSLREATKEEHQRESE